jgi:hypothetical protein
LEIRISGYANRWMEKHEGLGLEEEICRLIGRQTDGFSFAGLQELFVGLSLMEARGTGKGGAVEEGRAAPEETCQCTTCPMAVDKDTPPYLRDNVLVKRSNHYIGTLRGEMSNKEPRVDEEKGKQVSKNELPSRERRRCC